MSEKKTAPDPDDRPIDWPNAVRNRRDLDAALEEGLSGGVSNRTWDEIVEDRKRKMALG